MMRTRADHQGWLIRDLPEIELRAGIGVGDEGCGEFDAGELAESAQAEVDEDRGAIRVDMEMEKGGSPVFDPHEQS